MTARPARLPLARDARPRRPRSVPTGCSPRSARAAWASSTSRRGLTAAGVALKVLRPHIVGDVEARERLAREVSSLKRITSPRIAEIIDADPHGEVPYVVTRYVPGSLALPPRGRGGRGRGRRPAALRRLPRRGAARGALRRRAAPRREADQRADGGPLAGPDRLRAGPGRRGPPAHPDRLAARYARLPRPGDPVRRRPQPGLRRPRLGRDRGVRRDRPSAVRQGAGDGDHGPGPPRRARPLRHRRPDASAAARGALARPARAAVASTSCARPSPTCGRGQRRRCAAAGRAGARALDDAVRSRADAGDGAHQDVPLETAGSALPPAGRSLGEVPVREATPYQQPTPADPRRRPGSSRSGAGGRPGPAVRAAPAGDPAGREPSRSQRRLQIAGLGLLAGATVAYAPYLGTAPGRLRRPAAAHGLGHPAAARPAADGPRPRPVVRRARPRPCRRPATSCSPCSARSRSSRWPRWSRSRSSRSATCSTSRSAPTLTMAGLGFAAVAVVGAGVRPGAGDDPRPASPGPPGPSSAAGSWS